jgi:hypothetical protein
MSSLQRREERYANAHVARAAPDGARAMTLEHLALWFVLVGALGLALAAWKGDVWCIGVAIGFVFLSFITWYYAAR